MIEIALSRVVDKSHQEALKTSISILIDQFHEDLANLEAGGSFADTSMAVYLPEKNLSRYSLLFAKQFFVCLNIVSWKLFSRHREELCCLAEELALKAIIDCASAVLEMDNKEADFSALYDSAFQDLDFEILFTPSLDGFEDTPAGKEMGIGYLRFEDWFKQFKNTGPVHPYVVGGSVIRPEDVDPS